MKGGKREEREEERKGGKVILFLKGLVYVLQLMMLST